MNSQVFFAKDINSKNLVKVFEALEKTLPGKTAVKVHSGEQGNQNFLRPEFYKDIIAYLDGTVVECNTAYPGERNSTKKHQSLIRKRGWDTLYPFDLLDAEGPDLELPIENGKILKKDYLGKNLANYKSMLIVSHFKGHPMGGYGGALKQLSIGCASTRGKAYIHSAGQTTDQTTVWNNLPSQDDFLASMADAASAVIKYFTSNLAFINVMANMSVDCDCCATAEDPCLKDIGILASLDPVAIDQACIDLVKSSSDPGVSHFMERVNSRHGEYTIECAEALGLGSRNYDLVKL